MGLVRFPFHQGHSYRRIRDAVVIAASGTGDLFGGADLLPLLVLALGGALAVGNGLALLRPPVETKEGDLSRAPAARSIVMLVVGLIAAIWAVATLTS
jgi:hypothetical protein